MLTDYVFEELPLATADGYVGLFADGIADIECFRDGRWKVASIRVRLAKYELGKAPVYKHVVASPWVAQAISLTLLNDPHWRDRVQEAAYDAWKVEDLENARFRQAYGRAVQV